MYLIKIQLINILANDLNQFGIPVKLDIFCIYLLNFIYNTCIMRSKNLCAIIPVSFITVVFTWIMTCCDIDTTLTIQITDSITDLRCWAHIIEEIDLDAIGRKDICRSLSKQTAVITTVMTNNNRNLLQILKILVEIICQALSCSSDSIYIHTVAA